MIAPDNDNDNGVLMREDNSKNEVQLLLRFVFLSYIYN